MHLKVGRTGLPALIPHSTSPFGGCWGGSFSIAPARPAQGKGGRQDPGPAAVPPPASPHLQRDCGSAQHQRTIPPPAATSGRLQRRLPRGPGWAAAGFRANLFKREAAAGLERQGSAFLRQSTGRHACCNPIHGGSSTDTASDNPPRPAPALSVARQLN